LIINLFINSSLNWSERNIDIQQYTKWPFEDFSEIVIKEGKKQRFAMHIRYPAWAKQGYRILVNGKEMTFDSQPGSYVTIDRRWRKGDRVRVVTPMNLSLMKTPDPSSKVNVLYGPIVLAAALGNDAPIPIIETPVLVSGNQNVSDWLEMTDSSKLIFRTKDVGMPHQMTLMPFFNLYDQKHTVYFDLFTKDEWAKQKDDIERVRAERKALEEATTDFIALGEQQPEHDHNLAGENTYASAYKGRRWRIASGGEGWFSFDMKIDPDAQTKLMCTYYGSDSDRQFNVLVDGQVVGEERMKNAEAPGKFIDRVYTLPLELTTGKKTINVKFKCYEKKASAAVYDCRTIR
jgi:hypothetical protein